MRGGRESDDGPSGSCALTLISFSLVSWWLSSWDLSTSNRDTISCFERRPFPFALMAEGRGRG
jgi:hypothetical protein